MSAAIPANSEEIITALRRLTERIATTVAEAKSEGLLRPTEDNYSRYIVTNGAVKDSDYGVERVSFELEHFTKESWFHATRIVVWRVGDTEEYVAAAALLNRSILADENRNRILERFTHSVAYTFIELEAEGNRRAFVEKQFLIITKHLNQEVFHYSTTVRLTGIVAPATPAHFHVADTEVLLRRVTADDLIDERSDFLRRETFPRDPKAILRLILPATFGAQVQRKIWKAITILRLFKVSSLRELSYTTETESYFGDGGTLTTHDHQTVIITSSIEDSDVPRLVEFWRRLDAVIPEEGYERSKGQVNPIEIAYQRYSDSLQTWGATVERRISDAVMGLESLFLTENQELAYRLRTRIARVFGLLNLDPYVARDIANDAYTVRSSYVHGDRVSVSSGKNIVKRYGTFESLLYAVLDQLRIAIVVLTLCGHTKEEFIRLIDNSFIDQKVLPELEEIIAPIKTLVDARVESADAGEATQG